MVSNLNAGVGTQNKGGIADLRNDISSATANAERSKTLAAEARARRDAQAAAGNGNMGAGSAQAAQGAVSMGMGVVQIIVGKIMMGVGEPGCKVAGIAMMVTGLGQVATGTMQMSQGNEKIAQGTSQLANAAQEGVISKEQAGVANKEMIRSQIFKSKLEMMEATMTELDQSGKLKGANGEDLSQEQLDKLKAGGQEMFDKGFAAGAEAIRNGGIMSMQDGSDTRYFIQTEEGQIGPVNVIKGEDGKPELDKHGSLQLDLKNPVEGDPELSDEKKLELMFNFAIMNQMKDMITGNAEAGITGLSRIEIDPATGEVREGKFDILNPQHLDEFADLAEAAGKNPPPLKYDKDEKGLYFQAWDWDKKEAKGEKTYIQDMAGGTIDRNDPNWKDKAKTTASEAFKKAGLGEDTDTYKLLKPLVDESAHNDANPINIDEYRSFWRGLKPESLRDYSTSTRGSSFANNSNRISFA